MVGMDTAIIIFINQEKKGKTMIELARSIQDRIDSNNVVDHKEAVRMFESATSVVSSMDSEYVDRLEILWNEYKSE